MAGNPSHLINFLETGSRQSSIRSGDGPPIEIEVRIAPIPERHPDWPAEWLEPVMQEIVDREAVEQQIDARNASLKERLDSELSLKQLTEGSTLKALRKSPEEIDAAMTKMAKEFDRRFEEERFKKEDLDKQTGIVRFSDENGKAQRVFRDADNSGQFVLLNDVQARQLYDDTYNQMRREIDGPSEFLVEALAFTAEDLDYRATVSFGRDIPVAAVTNNSLVSAYTSPEPQQQKNNDVVAAAPVRAAPEVDARALRRGVVPEARRPEIAPAPATPDPQTGFQQQLSEYSGKFGDLSGHPDILTQLPSILTRIDRAFRGPDLDARGERAIMRELENVQGPQGQIQGILADFVQKRIEAGESLLRREEYQHTVNAVTVLKNGGSEADVQKALNGETPAVASTEVTAKVEPAAGGQQQQHSFFSGGAGGTPKDVNDARIEVLKQFLEPGTANSAAIPENTSDPRLQELRGGLQGLEASNVSMAAFKLQAVLGNAKMALSSIERFGDNAETAAVRDEIYSGLGQALQSAIETEVVGVNFAGVVSGDFQDPSTIKIDLDKLPQSEAYDAIRNALQEYKNIFESMPESKPDQLQP